MSPTKPHRQFLLAIKEKADASAIPEVTRFFRVSPDVDSSDNKILGARFGEVFALAKQFSEMPLAEIETLLENPFYEVRMGAVSMMDFQARMKRITAEHRKSLFDLYIRRHDRINNWDLVDRAAPYVVGGYLADKSREVLYKLAKSRNPWERRTAIVSTYYFIRGGDVEDTFRIAAQLVGDDHDLVQKAVGSWLREAGKKDEKQLLTFLKTHSSAMSRPMLRYAVEKLPPTVRAKYI